jgi:phosphonopyruvate decarboxylase
MLVEDFVSTLTDAGFGPFTGVPDSIFLPLVNYLERRGDVDNLICSSEGEAMGLAGGFALAQRTPVVYMQNDGYGNAVNPLSSLQLTYDLPALLLISWRGEPGVKDAPQHHTMGETIRGLLDLFDIPFSVLTPDEANLTEKVEKARGHCASMSLPYAFLIKRGTFSPVEGTPPSEPDSLSHRHEYIRALCSLTGEEAMLLGATGYCGRELHQLVEGSNKFYMMGSMGCLASVGLAVAMEHPDKRVYVLDGDGALLMKMGTLSTVGYHGPANLVHICFDNAAYESTGGQPTTSSTTDFAAIANACGYPSVSSVESLADFTRAIPSVQDRTGPHFITVRIASGTPENLPRPAEDAFTMARAFSRALGP